MSPSVETPVPWYFRGSITPLKRAKDGHELDASPGTAPAVATPPARDLRSDILVPLPSLGNDFCVNQFENPAVAAWGLAQLSREIRRAGKNIDSLVAVQHVIENPDDLCREPTLGHLRRALHEEQYRVVVYQVGDFGLDRVFGNHRVLHSFLLSIIAMGVDDRSSFCLRDLQLAICV